MKGSAGYAVRTYVCQGCKREVTRRARPGARYCSHPCYARSPKPGRKTGEERRCEVCRAPFYAQASRAPHQGRFCSVACHDVAQGAGKTTHLCKTCGVEFHWSPSRTQSGRYRITYCSMPCRDADPARRTLLLAMNTAQQSQRTTRAEAAGYALLDRLGVEYERQSLFAGKFTPDALVPSARTVVQFDGDYWHDRRGTSTEPRIQRRVALDHSQDAYVGACGWTVLRLWEGDLRDDPAGCEGRVRRHLRLP